MEKLKELLDCLSCASYETNFAIAKSTYSCIMCGKPARVFRDGASKLEYTVSALCQRCQDEYFRNG